MSAATQAETDKGGGGPPHGTTGGAQSGCGGAFGSFAQLRGGGDGGEEPADECMNVWLTEGRTWRQNKLQSKLRTLSNNGDG